MRPFLPSKTCPDCTTQAVLVFDLSQEDSFEKAKEWLEDLRKHVEPDIVLAIVGNKSDAPSAFDFKIAEDYAESICCAD